MPISSTSLVERIARVLAGRAASSNAGGDDSSAGPTVDETWRDHQGDALAILHTLREPDQAMADAGDAAIWEQMVRAALTDAEADAAL